MQNLKTFRHIAATVALGCGLSFASLGSTAAELNLASSSAGQQIIAQTDASLQAQDASLRSELQQQLRAQLIVARTDAALLQQQAELRSELQQQLQTLLPTRALQVAFAR